VIYREFQPSPALRSTVDRLYYLEGAADEIGAEPIPPDGHTEIIVHAGDPFLQIDGDGHASAQERVLFAGQVTRAVRVAPAGTARLIGARLHPDAARQLTAVPQQELTDIIVPLAQIERALARTLADDVATRDDPDQMAAALDRALSRARVRAAARGESPSAARLAVAHALDCGGLVRVSDLAQRAGLGERQLERVFRDRVGLNPKLFLRIVRFQHVLATLRQGRGDTAWAAVAAQHGFYDQSHFIRDFKAFVGAAPGAWQVDESSLTALFSALRRSSGVTS
jgi:AraC-like DNA-binding protein